VGVLCATTRSAPLNYKHKPTQRCFILALLSLLLQVGIPADHHLLHMFRLKSLGAQQWFFLFGC
jgi:hypothetical protein